MILKSVTKSEKATTKIKVPQISKSHQQGQKAPVIDHKKFTHDFEKFSILALKRVVDHKTP